MQVDQALVNLHFITIPGLGTLTARLEKKVVRETVDGLTTCATYSLTGGDLENLGGKTDGALDTELLVLCAGNQISRDCGTFKKRGLSRR